MVQVYLRFQDYSVEKHGRKIFNKLNFDLYQGEFLGILGRAGSGKSFISDILCGENTGGEYSGKIFCFDQPMMIRDIHDSKTLGIYRIREQSGLIPTLSIAQNLLQYRSQIKDQYIESISGITFSWWISNRQLESSADAILQEWGFPHNSKTLVGRLTPAERHILEIIRAVLRGSTLIVFDEITNHYNETELRTIETYLEKLRKQNITVLWLDSKPETMTSFCDRIMVLKDGQNAGCFFKEEFSHSVLTALMQSDIPPASTSSNIFFSSTPILQATLEVPLEQGTAPFNFHILSGEIVGLVADNNLPISSIVDQISGKTINNTSQIYVQNKLVHPQNVHQAQELGIVRIDGFSDQKNMIPTLSTEANAHLLVLDRLCNGIGLISNRILRYSFQEGLARFGLSKSKMPSNIHDLTLDQKLYLYIMRRYLLHPKIIIMPQLFEDIDAASAQLVLSLIKDLQNEGISFLITTTRTNLANLICNRTYTL